MESLATVAAVASFSLLALSKVPPQPTDFINAVDLEKGMKAYCLKKQVLNSPAQTHIIESTSRRTQGFHFESIRFQMNKKGVEGTHDCKAQREIIHVKRAKKKNMLFLIRAFTLRLIAATPFVIRNLLLFTK